MIKKLFTILITFSLLFFNTSLLNADDKDALILNVINNMSLEEKIGQMFIIRIEMLNPEYISDKESGKTIIHTDITDEMKDTYSNYPCGGFILFSKNITDEEQLKSLTSSIHELSDLTPIVSIDEEGGSVSRIANNSNFDVVRFQCNEKIAESGNTDKAYELGYMIGSYLKEYGIDLDFAPVADINTNPNNKVIGQRAFGSDPYTAAKMVNMAIAGFHDVGMATCIKHFPGHGDTSSDSHLGRVYTYKTWDELKQAELIPFEYGISKETEMIMVGHISAPNITGNDDPATLSYELLTNKLRNELGYQGVIISDSFEMGAITEYYETKDALIKAINAGVDIILMPENYIEAFECVKQAVLDNEITEERINESVYRILSMKNKMFDLFNTEKEINSTDTLIIPSKNKLEIIKTNNN